MQILVVVVSLALGSPSSGADRTNESTSRPMSPVYRIHANGTVTLRVCFNWSCATRQHLTFSASEMAEVAELMALCQGDGLHNRLQKVRIGIWQMESLAAKHQPLLANDEAVNDRDRDHEGRMDCIDNTSNTTSYLHVLHELGLLPGWSMAEPEIRGRFSMQVHWTAVLIDKRDARAWAVDSWFRPNAHLPFVMPLAEWESYRFPWDSKYATLNTIPRYTNQFCRV